MGVSIALQIIVLFMNPIYNVRDVYTEFVRLYYIYIKQLVTYRLLYMYMALQL